jgi:sugar porter (SP) family MFS transporter
MSGSLVRAVFAANLLSLIAGYCIGVVHRAAPYMEMEFGMTAELQFWAFNSLLLGCAAGSLFITRPADFRGRRPVMAALALVLLFSIVATSVISNFMFFCIFRFLTGIAIGGISVLVPVYLSELSPPSIRGRTVLSFPLALIAGILFSFIADFWFRDTGGNNWRFMILSGAIPALLFFIFRIFLPESPRFLLQKGLEQETDVVIERLDPDVNKFTFRQEYKRTVDMRLLRKTSKLFELPLLKINLFCIITGMIAMLTGVNSVVVYAAGLADAAGMTRDAISWPGLLMGGSSLISLAMAFYFIDRVGRKKLLVTGTMGIAASLFILAVFLFTGLQGVMIPYLVLFFYFGFLASSAGTLIWVIFPEMFPNTARIRGVSYGLASFWFANFLTSLLVPFLMETPAISITFIIYGALTLWGSFFFSRNFRETKGTSLEEIAYFKQGDTPKSGKDTNIPGYPGSPSPLS